MKLTKPLACFDIESTGTDPAKDRIVSLAIVVKYSDDDKVVFNQLINPAMPIPPSATECHHITDEMVKDCPEFTFFAATIHAVIMGCDLLGFGLRNFDVPLLWEEFARCGIIWDLKGVNIIDCGTIFKKKEERTLTAGLKFYCNEVLGGAHDALNDVNATMKVFNGQRKMYPDLGTMTVEELAKFSEYDRRVDLAGKLVFDKDGDPSYAIGQSKGEKVKNNPGMARWMLSKDFTSETKQVLRRLLDEIECQGQGSMFP